MSIIARLNDRDADIDIRGRAVSLLGEIQDKSAVPHLLAFLKEIDLAERPNDPYYKIIRRGEVFAALGKIGDATAVPYLLPLLAREDLRESLEVMSVVDALGEIKSPTAVPHLIKLWEESNTFAPGVGTSVLGALAKIKEPTALPHLIGALDNQNELIHDSAVNALRQFGWKPETEEQKRNFRPLKQNQDDLEKTRSGAVRYNTRVFLEGFVYLILHWFGFGGFGTAFR